MDVRTLIFGGGLTGLSTAYHLDKRAAARPELGDWLLIERDDRLGGVVMDTQPPRGVGCRGATSSAR